MQTTALQQQIAREHELLTAALSCGDAECAAAHAGAIRAYDFVRMWEETTRATVGVLAREMRVRV